jgi:hypothetical protein
MRHRHHWFFSVFSQISTAKFRCAEGEARFLRNTWKSSSWGLKPAETASRRTHFRGRGAETSSVAPGIALATAKRKLFKQRSDGSGPNLPRMPVPKHRKATLIRIYHGRRRLIFADGSAAFYNGGNEKKRI